MENYKICTPCETGAQIEHKYLHKIVTKYVAKSMAYFGGLDVDDVYQELYLAALEALARWDATKGTTPAMWVHYLLVRSYKRIALETQCSSAIEYDDEAVARTTLDAGERDAYEYALRDSPALQSYVAHGSATPYAVAHAKSRMWAHREMQKEVAALARGALVSLWA